MGWGLSCSRATSFSAELGERFPQVIGLELPQAPGKETHAYVSSDFAQSFYFIISSCLKGGCAGQVMRAWDPSEQQTHLQKLDCAVPPESAGKRWCIS